jgi:hypothetical protein
MESIPKRLKSVTPAKAGVQKRTENTVIAHSFTVHPAFTGMTTVF